MKNVVSKLSNENLILIESIPEIGAKTTTLLESLRKHLVLAHVSVTDGSASKLHGLFKVVAANFRNWIGFLDFLKR